MCVTRGGGLQCMQVGGQLGKSMLESEQRGRCERREHISRSSFLPPPMQHPPSPKYSILQYYRRPPPPPSTANPPPFPPLLQHYQSPSCPPPSVLPTPLPSLTMPLLPSLTSFSTDGRSSGRLARRSSTRWKFP